MKKVAIVTASDAAVGIGHLRRAQRLQVEMQSRGDIKTTLVMSDVADFDVSVFESLASDVVVIDLPSCLHTTSLDRALRSLRHAGTKVVGIDEFCTEIDLLIVPSFHVNDDNLNRARDSGLPIRWGWDRLIIERRQAIAPRVPGSPVLILTGGSDAAGLGEHLPATLESRLPAGTVVAWVTGPLAVPPKFPTTQRLQWIEHRDVVDLRPLMHSAGYALAVYGVTVLELLHHGVPTVSLSLDISRDREHFSILESEGLARTDTDAISAVDKLSNLLANEEWSQAIAGRAANRIPEPGTMRVVEDICESVS